MAKRRWLKVYCDIRDREWYDTPGMLGLWMRLLLEADENGVVTTSERRLAEVCGVSRQQLRTMLGKLLANQLATKSSTKHPTKPSTKLTICDYASYIGSATNGQTNQQPKQQPSIQPMDGSIPFSYSLNENSEHKEREKDKKEISPKGDTKKEEKESDPDFERFMAWLAENAPSVARLDSAAAGKYRFSPQNFRALRDAYGSRALADTILEMENWAGLTTKQTAYLTLAQWLKKAKEGKKAVVLTGKGDDEKSVNALWRRD